ncbi:hypothetical protein Ocin01_17899 [Orchesella cincta]|uniref:Uncharacterized protein n=1 Tax=Orchesella cincta TaxID=48709 RepID=A0A1D2M732_ORCCI|nr:hypothetical protein Ocin01_17899 [Orchesella cincta]
MRISIKAAHSQPISSSSLLELKQPQLSTSLSSTFKKLRISKQNGWNPSDCHLAGIRSCSKRRGSEPIRIRNDPNEPSSDFSLLVREPQSVPKTNTKQYNKCSSPKRS